MIEPITLARPYAKAAFEHARGAGELAQWQEALAQLAAVTRDHKVSVMLKSPNQTAQQRAENLATLVGDSLPASVVNLLMIMADNGRLSLLPEVATLFEQFKQAVESTVTVVVTSAYPLSDDETRRAQRDNDIKTRPQRYPNIRNRPLPFGWGHHSCRRSGDRWLCSRPAR